MINRRLLSTILLVVKSIPLRLREGQYFSVASALAFSSVLALVPLLTVVFSALSLFPVADKWSEVIETFLYDNLLPHLGDQVQAYLSEFSANAGQLTIWGMGFLLVTTLALLATIENAFNVIWHVKKGRPFSQRIVVYWAMLTLGPILIAVSLSVSSYLWSQSFLPDPIDVSAIKSIFLSMLPFVLQLIAFSLLYTSVPNCTVSIKHALIGALIAALLFELAKYGFAQYVKYFTAYQRIYGALAILPVFLIWIFLSWLVVLIGAYITAAFGEHDPALPLDR